MPIFKPRVLAQMTKPRAPRSTSVPAVSLALSSGRVAFRYIAQVRLNIRVWKFHLRLVISKLMDMIKGLVTKTDPFKKIMSELRELSHAKARCFFMSVLIFIVIHQARRATEKESSSIQGKRQTQKASQKETVSFLNLFMSVS